MGPGRAAPRRCGGAAPRPGRGWPGGRGAARRSAIGLAGAEHEVGPAVLHRRAHQRELGRIERAVAVHEADAVALRRLQAGEAGRAEAAPGLAHHLRPEARGQLGRAVARAVVGHERAEARGHPAQHPGERRRLVEHREHHVDHGLRPLRAGPYRSRTHSSPRGADCATFGAMEAGTGAFAARTRGPELGCPSVWPSWPRPPSPTAISARASGVQLGAGLAPFLADWRPAFRPHAPSPPPC